MVKLIHNLTRLTRQCEELMYDRTIQQLFYKEHHKVDLKKRDILIRRVYEGDYNESRFT